MSLTPVANGKTFNQKSLNYFDFPPVSTTLAVTVAKFAAGVIDTGGAPRLANISANFRTKMIHEKNQKPKISRHCPFKEKIKILMRNIIQLSRVLLRYVYSSKLTI